MIPSTKLHTFIVTAVDATFFDMCLGLVLSIRSQAHPHIPDIGVLDVGLTEIQRNILRGLVTELVIPDWDYDLPGKRESYPDYFKAMTARPHLPKYFPGRDVYLWIDADAWIQDWTGIQTVACSAEDGKLAIVRERYNKGDGVRLEEYENGRPKRLHYTAETVRKNVANCYRNAFGDELADTLGNLPSYNSCVFALRGDSESWKVWAEYLRQGLEAGFNHLVEQQALNVAIYQGSIPIRALPWRHNFLCIHALPEIDLERQKFVTPDDPSEVISVMHLSNARKTRIVPIRIQQTDQIEHFPIKFLSLAMARN
jgi:hypothetical protein